MGGASSFKLCHWVLLLVMFAPLMENSIWVVQTTLPGEWIEPVVGQWSTSLIQSGFAACVQRSRVTSVYSWQESIQSGDEWRIQVKTTSAKKDNLIDAIIESHPFETPQISAWEAGTTSDYASWVEG